jgi:guanylate kinase
MDLLVEFGKIILPAAAVMYAMYLTIKMFMQKEWQSQKIMLSQKSTETILPIRLQAYERMCLFLERISPNNLIVRLNNREYNAAQFQHVLLSEVREEYNHNLSQQVYMSDEAWNMVRRAMEDLVVKINQAGSEVESFC